MTLSDAGKLAGAMRARIAVAVIALTTLICVVVVAGGGPVGGGDRTPDPYVPTEQDLREIGVITDDFPVPGRIVSTS